MEFSNVTVLLRRTFTNQLRRTARSLVILLALGLTISEPVTHSRPARISAAFQGQAPLQVLRWQRPDRGWIYVLDPNKGNDSGEILLINTKTGTVQGILETGYDPDFAVSHDGTRLYVVSGHSWLSVFDTQKGIVLSSVTIPNRVMYTVLPYISSLAISPQDTWLYISTVNENGVMPDFRIAIFDTATEHLLDEQIPLPKCGTARLSPGPEEREMAIHCIDTNDMRRLQLAGDGRVTSENRIALPSATPIGDAAPQILYRAALVFQRGSRALGVVMGDGTTFMGSLADDTNFTKVKAGSEGQCVPPRAWPMSVDSSRVYVGVSACHEYSADGYAFEISILDTSTMKELARHKITAPFWCLVESLDGASIFASSPGTHSLLVLDSNGWNEIRRIENVGKAPSLLMLAP